jgi:cellulose synthase/poly-beta-1,6-N-acetylglucosamine synthase-like glycosyltransferase
MDEAFVEALVVERGMQVRYAPDAVVYNTGPTTVHDFVAQRRRNHAGHLYLKSKYGYAVSSIQNSRVAKIAFKEVWGVVRLIGALGFLAVLEMWSRLLGWYDFAIRRERHVVWDMAWSQKVDVQAERDQALRDDDCRPKALATDAGNHRR